MWNFLKRHHETPTQPFPVQGGQDYEITHLTPYGLTFISQHPYPLRKVMVLKVTRKQANRTAHDTHIHVLIDSSRSVGATSFEYTAHLHHVPPEFAEWLQAGSFRRDAEGHYSIDLAHPHSHHAHRVFTTMSRELPGFKAIANDIGEDSVTLMAAGPVEVGHTLHMVLDLDDFRFPNIRATGQVASCTPVEDGHFALDVTFTDIDNHHRDVIRAYIDFVEHFHAEGFGMASQPTPPAEPAVHTLGTPIPLLHEATLAHIPHKIRLDDTAATERQAS